MGVEVDCGSLGCRFAWPKDVNHRGDQCNVEGESVEAKMSDDPLFFYGSTDIGPPVRRIHSPPPRIAP